MPPVDRSEEAERERIRRIRDKRIKRNDPGPRIKNVNWNPDRDKHKIPKPLIIELWLALSPRWRGAIIGMVFGLFVLIPAFILLEGLTKLFGLLGFGLCILVMMVVWQLAEKD